MQLESSPSEIFKKPDWLKVKAPSKDSFFFIKDLVNKGQLSTVCQSANCPNIAQCWEGGTATFMLLGNVCTRACRFCSVQTGNPHGLLDTQESKKVAETVKKMKLHYVVLTSVDRDDLPDQGASSIAETIKTIFEYNENILIEILSPDFSGNKSLLEIVLKSSPHVFAHNIETVRRLSPKVRDRRASYETSLDVLKQAKISFPKILTKSSIMLGLGETDTEVMKSLEDLRSIDVDVVTLGQYLSPTKQLARHLPVQEFIHPDKFKEWEITALKLGFRYVASGPLVRSSYRAGEYFIQNMLKKG